MRYQHANVPAQTAPLRLDARQLLALRRQPFNIAASYALAAMLWIALSDRALGSLSSDPDTLLNLGVWKGVGFVLATAALLYALLRRYFRLLDSAFQMSIERESQRVRAQSLADSTIESMPGIFYLYDVRRKFLRWNRNFERVSGYSGAELANMHPLDFFVGDDKLRVQERVAEVFAVGESSVEAAFVSKTGTTRPYFFTGRRVLLEQGECLVGVGVDISQRKAAEDALRSSEERYRNLNEELEQRISERTRDLAQARERAEAADRIKSSFLATMSHELRTPLNSIIGFTGIVLQGLAGPLTAEQSKQLGMVQTSARHLLALINDVLDISKIEAGQLEVSKEPFELRTAIQHVLDTIAPLAQKKDLALRVSLPEALGAVRGDQRRLEQILLNLLNNAVKFTERGEITLRVTQLPERPVLQLDVADTGVGIKAEDVPKLFQPFRQLDSGLERKHEGTGLGLAICQRLTELLGGRIHVESTWGQGSTFTVELPT